MAPVLVIHVLGHMLCWSIPTMTYYGHLWIYGLRNLYSLYLIVLCQFSKKLVLATLSLRWWPFTAFIGIKPRRKSASLTFLLQNDLKRVKAVVGSCDILWACLYAQTWQTPMLAACSLAESWPNTGRRLPWYAWPASAKDILPGWEYLEKREVQRTRKATLKNNISIHNIHSCRWQGL